jgi:hypothetical protein
MTPHGITGLRSVKAVVNVDEEVMSSI